MATDQKQHGCNIQSRQHDNCQTPFHANNTNISGNWFQDKHSSFISFQLFPNMFYLVGWHSQLRRDEAPNARPQKPRHVWLVQQSVSSGCVLAHKTSHRTAPLSPTQGQPMRNRAIVQRCVITVQYLQYFYVFVIAMKKKYILYDVTAISNYSPW